MTPEYVASVLEKLRIKSGLRGERRDLGGPWRIGFFYERITPGAPGRPAEGQFDLTLYYGSRSKTIDLPDDAVETRGRSPWMTDNTWRLTPSTIERQAVGIAEAIAATEARAQNRSGGALPPGFEGFGAEVFEQEAPAATDEPWRIARPLAGLRLGDRIVVGRQPFVVVRAWDDFEVMAQKPGAKRKAFSVWQNGPTVEVREQRGSPETTMAGPVLTSAPYDQVQVVRGDENRSMASYRHATSGQHLRSLSEMLRGSDPFPVLRDFYDSQGPKRQGWIRAIDALSTDELLGVAQIAASYGTAVGVELRDQAQEILRRRAVKGSGEMNRAGSGSDVFGRNEIVVQFDDGPEFAKAFALGDVEDATEKAIAEVRFSPGTRAKAFMKASPKMLPDEKDGPILLALEAAPLPLGYISNALLYSTIDRLPAREKARLYRLVKGGHVRVVRTWRPTPQYWLMAK